MNRAWVVALLALALAALAGCDTQAFCFTDCETATTTAASSSSSASAGSGTSGGGGDDGCFPNCGVGGAPPTMCTPTNGGIEICDGQDNDCNDAIDEGFDLTSPKNCGTCATNCYATLLNCNLSKIVCEPSSKPGVDPGKCVCDECASDYHDLNGDEICEYYCAPTANNDVTCDNKDDDCDNLKDEDVDLCGSVTDCGYCGHNCSIVHATAKCVSAGGPPCDGANTACAIDTCACPGPGDCWWDLDNQDDTGCEYNCDLTNGGVEICDGLDNDCDGKVDAADNLAADAQIGTACSGDPDGECATVAHAGVWACEGGKAVCGGAAVLHENDVLEMCNGLDDDCDGAVDEAAIDAGASCGVSNIFPCSFGKIVCVAGMLVCGGNVDPTVETCNAQDDDCDGTIDDATVDSGGSCGTSNVAPCMMGTIVCTGGALLCAGQVDPALEECDNLDNDCDGVVDNGVPGAGSSCGQSNTAPCSFGTLLCQNGGMTCVGAANPTAETCNGVDDDCNGTVDDNTAGSGGVCGQSGTFPCQKGTIQCQGAVLLCIGNVDPQPEACNGNDDDCDGVIDDAPGGVGASCGQSGTLPCKLGTTQCQAGAIVCVGALDPKPETCNGKDDDCDGQIDDGAIGVGVACGQNGTLPCKLGTTSCQAGAIVCTGAINPKPETCNGSDDDCDGVIDDNPTDSGVSCGVSNTFPCSFGAKQCQAGGLVCVGNVNPKTETCNGQDDNCDGQVDKTGVNPPADSVGACSVPIPPPAGATSPCLAGAKACVAGGVQCVGAKGPTGVNDTCGVDANCDGLLTNQPNKQTDVANCGACGTNCLNGAVQANWACVAGACQFQGCLSGYYDLNNDQKCETACVFVSATEACNGNDDNCNGQIDEGVVAPSPSQICGVSPSATSAACTSGVSVACTSGAWKCTFPAGVCSPTCATAAEVCDTLDNDCDGLTNENVANYGKPCASDDGLAAPGHGACRTTGTVVCNGANATKCSAVMASCAGLAGGCTELCDGTDNDCDGLVDESTAAKGTNATYYVKPAVTKIGAALWAMTYEASRPSANTTAPGSGNGYHCKTYADPGCSDATIPLAPAGVTIDKTPACSVPTKIPWFNVTPAEAEQTCKARGGRLCTTTDWQTACTATAACKWGYYPRNAACTTTYAPATKYCNLGPSFDFDAALAGDQDGLLVTKSSALKNCWSDWSGLQGNVANPSIFDMTGNLREITKSAANTYPLMGGSFATGSEDGAACGFSFYTVDNAFQLFDLGFRCCFTADPSP